MKHLKKFNEEFDPMGSWNPNHSSNKIKKEFSDDELKELVKDSNSLEEAFEEGLDPTIKSNILLRLCFRDNLVNSFNTLIDRIIEEDNFGTDAISRDVTKLKLAQWASEYGRIEFLKKFNELGWFNDFSEKNWDDLFNWLRISRILNRENREDDKEKTKQFLLNIKSEK